MTDDALAALAAAIAALGLDPHAQGASGATLLQALAALLMGQHHGMVLMHGTVADPEEAAATIRALRFDPANELPNAAITAMEAAEEMLTLGYDGVLILRDRTQMTVRTINSFYAGSVQVYGVSTEAQRG